jgi:hypothetical protein
MRETKKEMSEDKLDILSYLSVGGLIHCILNSWQGKKGEVLLIAICCSVVLQCLMEKGKKFEAS